MVVRPKSVTPNIGKRTETDLESSAQGGVITPDRAITETQLSADTTENLATTKRSAGRRSVRQADNSRTTQQILTTVIVVECS